MDLSFQISAAERVKLGRRDGKQKKNNNKFAPVLQKRAFTPRDRMQEMKILYDMWSAGMDTEDMTVRVGLQIRFDFHFQIVSYKWSSKNRN